MMLGRSGLYDKSMLSSKKGVISSLKNPFEFESESCGSASANSAMRLNRERKTQKGSMPAIIFESFIVAGMPSPSIAFKRLSESSSPKVGDHRSLTGENLTAQSPLKNRERSIGDWSPSSDSQDKPNADVPYRYDTPSKEVFSLSPVNAPGMRTNRRLPFDNLVTEAIANLVEKGGSSVNLIVKHCMENVRVKTTYCAKGVVNSLRRLCKSGKLFETKPGKYKLLS